MFTLGFDLVQSYNLFAFSNLYNTSINSCFARFNLILKYIFKKINKIG